MAMSATVSFPQLGLSFSTALVDPAEDFRYEVLLTAGFPSVSLLAPSGGPTIPSHRWPACFPDLLSFLNHPDRPARLSSPLVTTSAFPPVPPLYEGLLTDYNPDPPLSSLFSHLAAAIRASWTHPYICPTPAPAPGFRWSPYHSDSGLCVVRSLSGSGPDVTLRILHPPLGPRTDYFLLLHVPSFGRRAVTLASTTSLSLLSSTEIPYRRSLLDSLASVQASGLVQGFSHV